jgi:catechol 2,3-dioxygenase-like lactoylglutathione lyase family enzyme
MHVLQSRVLLRPSDMDAAMDFYERRLGLVRYREWGVEPHRGVVYFLGGGFVELTETPPGQPRPPPPAGVRLWLQAADAHAARDELEARWVEITSEPERKPWGLVELVVRDPDGLPLVVVETPADHPLRRDTRAPRE